VEPPALGADYDTEWARSPIARTVRGAIVAGPQRLLVDWVTDPEIHGRDRLADLLRVAERDDTDPPPVIFTPNHHSHLDTALMVRAVPAAWRRHLVTAAAADYFFDKRWKATLAALALNAIPIDRETTSRKSADLVATLIEDGWSLVIYPEGGRSPDGWGQAHKGGAAYLAGRTGAPVVPVYIDGTDSIMGKGTSIPKPGRTRVTFGSPLRRESGESTRRFSERIERAVAALADESTTDYWSARRRAATGDTPSLGGPAYTGWRRRWDVTRRRRRGIAAWRNPPKRRWPDL
jgi:1-acyl-sn-glycerol-3-phosphate acyltransferase